MLGFQQQHIYSVISSLIVKLCVPVAYIIITTFYLNFTFQNVFLGRTLQKSRLNGTMSVCFSCVIVKSDRVLL
jgi:hypothetical protein